ncbi:hypothetical protein [Rhizobium leguminosarum]|uniref:hypothetical protein n=1 Tax=Rhizobium leguminosarum TaxID=384 RepID=UPI0012BC066D|nr:hypothetical protein [Rhizobium leguminosarum]
MRNGFKNDTCAVAILNFGGIPGMAFGASDHPGASFGVLIRDGEPTCMRAWLAAIYPKNGIMLCISDIYSHRTCCDRVPAIEGGLSAQADRSPAKTTPGTAVGVNDRERFKALCLQMKSH